jgi:4-hydroxybenzoate polyprenyltransferase
MGYIQFRPIDTSCILLVLVVFFISAMSEILQEVRDHDSDRKMIVTTAISLGKPRALKLGLSFFGAICSMFVLSAILNIIPQLMILLFPLAYLIAKPILNAIRDEDYHHKMTQDISVRAPLIMIILIVAFILLRAFK